MIPKVCLILALLWSGVLTRDIPEDDTEKGIDTYARQCPSSSGLCVNAFKITIFGQAKMDKPHVVRVLVDIIIQYDMVLIQDIRDSAGTAIVELLTQVNNATTDPFEMTISPRLGRSSSKEQYCYFYRPSKMALVDTWQVPNNNPNPDADPESYLTFERPPYVAIFNSLVGGAGQFGVIGIHVKPDDAVAEIDALTDVYDNMTAQFGDNNFILGGDFNADCTYVDANDWANIRLRNDARFQWVIDDDVDTTVTSTDCAYDRLVLAGARLIYSYSRNSAMPYRFDVGMDLTPIHAEETSDNYPMEMALL